MYKKISDYMTYLENEWMKIFLVDGYEEAEDRLKKYIYGITAEHGIQIKGFSYLKGDLILYSFFKELIRNIRMNVQKNGWIEDRDKIDVFVADNDKKFDAMLIKAINRQKSEDIKYFDNIFLNSMTVGTPLHTACLDLIIIPLSFDGFTRISHTEDWPVIINEYFMPFIMKYDEEVKICKKEQLY